MRLIDDQQRVIGEILVQGRRRLPGLATGKVARVILHALAVAEFADHLDVVTGALLQALGLHQFIRLFKLPDARLQLDLDLADGVQHDVAGGHVVRLGENGNARHLGRNRAGQRVEEADVLDLFVEQLNAHRLGLGFRREHVDNVAAHAIRAAGEIDVVALVLQLGELAQHLALVDHLTARDMHDHFEVRLGIPQAVNRRDRGHDQAVLARHQGLGRGQTHLFDMLVDGGVLFDKGVRRGHVGLRLIIIVVRHEVLDRIVGEKLPELAVELRGQGFVMRHHDGRPLQALNHMGHGEGLARTGHAEQRLRRQAGLDAVNQRLDGGGLIACGFEG